MARKYRPNFRSDISRATAGLEEALGAYKDFVKSQVQTQIFNDNARRIVKSYNQKLARARNRGLSHLPEKQSLKEIRQQFPNRKDMQKYLDHLETFNKMGKSAFDVIETSGGGKLSRYQYYNIQANLEDTREFYRNQIVEAEKIFQKDPYSIARRDYVLNLQTKLEYLYRDVMELDQSGIRTFQKYINYYNNFERLNNIGYRNFLSGVTDIMERQGYDDKTINMVYDKISELTPAQFFKLYHENDAIDKIYDIIPSPEHGKGVINSKDKDARNTIKNFLNDLDNMIEKVKQAE